MSAPAACMGPSESLQRGRYCSEESDQHAFVVCGALWTRIVLAGLAVLHIWAFLPPVSKCWHLSTKHHARMGQHTLCFLFVPRDAFE